MGKIVICGDSFAIGLGCPDLTTEPWGPKIGKSLKRNVLNFAKGSSTNYSIGLQANYAIQNINDIDLLIISNTCSHRVNFFKEEEHIKRSTQLTPISNLDVNYHEYPPYGTATSPQVLDHPHLNNPDYKGTLNTENWHGIMLYNSILDAKEVPVKYFDMFKKDSRRLRLLREYYLEIFDIGIQETQDNGCLMLSYLKAKKNNIPVLLAMHSPEIKELVPAKDYVDINWGDLSINYPDSLGTSHTSPEGHTIASSKVLEHISKFNLLNII